MKNKFIKAYNLFMESISDEPTYENMSLALVPGSFKPPHKGHWEMIMSYTDKVDKVIVLISNISRSTISVRPLSLSNLKTLGSIRAEIEKFHESDVDEAKSVIDDLSEHANELSFSQISDGLKKILAMDNSKLDKVKVKIQKYLDRLNKYLFNSIRQTSQGREITPETSKAIFDIFAKAYGVENKVEIKVSKNPSSMTDALSIIEEECKDCKILMGVSKKGGDDARWAEIDKTDENGNIIKSAPVEVESMISATTLRDSIADLKREWFPDKITDEDFANIRSLLVEE